MTIERIERKWFGGKPKITELKPGHIEIVSRDLERKAHNFIAITIKTSDSIWMEHGYPSHKDYAGALFERENINSLRLPIAFDVRELLGRETTIRWKPSPGEQAVKIASPQKSPR